MNGLRVAAAGGGFSGVEVPQEVTDNCLCCAFIQSDSHPGQCWSSQHSQCRTGDHASDLDRGGPANSRYQSAGCCRLAAVSLTRQKLDCTVCLRNRCVSIKLS